MLDNLYIAHGSMGCKYMWSFLGCNAPP